jgi:hypothetical protein
MSINTCTYNVIKKEYGIITLEKPGLSFDEAYKLATPEEALAIYPNNRWIVRIRNTVRVFFQDENNKNITVSYQTKEKDSDIKIREFILYKE